MRDNWVIIMIMIVLCLAIFCVGTYGYFFIDKDVYSNPNSTTYVPPYNRIGSPKIFPNGMSCNVDRWKFTGDYYRHVVKYLPHEGAKFLWVYISAKNVGDLPESIPSEDDIYLLYKGRKFNPLNTSPSRQYWTQDRDEEIKLYPIGGSAWGVYKIYPGVKKDGWIHFEIPQNFHPEDARIVIWGEKWRLS